MQPPKNTLRADSTESTAVPIEASQDVFAWLEEDAAPLSQDPQRISPSASKGSTPRGELARTGVSITSRDEMNLAEFPLTVLSTRTNPNVKTLEFRDSQRLKTGELVEREWIITGADKFGLPTSTDDDVVLGLICLSMSHGFRERKVHFTRYELLKILRWSTEGRSYSRLTKSLDRLSGVRIRATNAFFDNSLKAYQTVNFGIIDAYEINDERGEGSRGGERTKSFFVWSDLMFDSFKNGFIKKIDLDLYFTLKSAVARRLYRYLDKHFYYRDTLERPLMTLAFEKLGLSRTYKYVSSVKQQLEPALEELIELNFLSGYEFINRGGVHLIKFYSQRSAAQAPQPIATPVDRHPLQEPVRAPETEDPLIAELTARGLSRHQVLKLLADSSMREAAPRAISYFDFLKAKSRLGSVKNLPGFLFRLIEDPTRIPEVKEESTPKGAPRPELKVIKAERTREASNNIVEPERIQEFKERLSAEERAALYLRVEEKISCLKGVLTRERFREAVEGCVNEEIAKMLREFPLLSMAGSI